MDKVTDREKLEHLLAGGVITTVDGVCRKLNSEGMFSFCDRDGAIYPSSSCSCIDFTNDIVLPWYKDIPEEGIVCFVWNVVEENKHVERVYKQVSSNCYHLAPGYGSYINAVPLTPEQIDLYNKLMGTAHAL